jgi:23S rRNA pseudouridine1911/1915/1917 synthase
MDPPDDKPRPDPGADADLVAVELDEEEVEHFQFRLRKTLERRIDQYLVDRLPYLSRANVQRLIDEQLVKVNGRPTKASYHPKADDLIDMVAPPKPISELVPQPIPLDIVYEDEHLLAINKQAGLMVHPARGVWTGTLVNALVHYGRQWSTVNGPWRPGILHRLDRNTTGIMLVAKSDEAHWRMARQFEDRTMQKSYLAIVHGTPRLRADAVEMPIGRDRYVREKQAVRKIEHGGKPAVTLYEVLETFARPQVEADARAISPAARRPRIEHFALVKFSPKTGRTHQIRVHAAALGLPLVGDTMYGGRIFESAGFRFERQALHAAEITFVHPGTRQPMTLAAPLPPDMQRLVELLRAA